MTTQLTAAHRQAQRDIFEIVQALDPQLGEFGITWNSKYGMTARHFSGDQIAIDLDPRNENPAAVVDELRAYVRQLCADSPDKYGNTESDPFAHCSFPDCGCDGARLCHAKSGPSFGATNLNVEHRSRMAVGADPDSQMATGADGRWIAKDQAV